MHGSPTDSLVSLHLPGLPFGLFGDMLGGEQHGSASIGSHAPNLFRGMVFGMTTRYACTDVSTPIWKLWDSFGIDQVAGTRLTDPTIDDEIVPLISSVPAAPASFSLTSATISGSGANGGVVGR